MSTEATFSPGQDSRVGDVEKTSQQSPVVSPRSFRKKIWTTCLIWTRRLHLYLGLILFPWVILYGVSGMLFNHPQAFQGNRSVSFRASEVSGKDVLTNLPDADELAHAIVQEVSGVFAEKGGPNVTLSHRREPEFSRYYGYNVAGKTLSQTVYVDPETGNGTIYYKTREEPEPQLASPLPEIKKLTLKENPVNRVQKVLPAILKELNLEAGKINVGNLAPNFVFSVDVDGVPCVMNYHLGTGDLVTQKEADLIEIPFRQLLLRLHTARFYTPQIAGRWFWAILVDAMFLAMVFWACSGIVMWWQIKRTRVWGSVMMTVSLIAATILVVEMHDVFRTNVIPKQSNAAVSVKTDSH